VAENFVLVVRLWASAVWPLVEMLASQLMQAIISRAEPAQISRILSSNHPIEGGSHEHWSL
jgi:hypothetical protein